MKKIFFGAILAASVTYAKDTDKKRNIAQVRNYSCEGIIKDDDRTLNQIKIGMNDNGYYTGEIGASKKYSVKFSANEGNRGTLQLVIIDSSVPSVMASSQTTIPTRSHPSVDVDVTLPNGTLARLECTYSAK